MTVYRIIGLLLLTTIPADVTIPPGFTGLTIDYFDDYSWKTFIPLVKEFESYKALWEVFHEDGSAPGSEAKYNACSAKVGPGDMVLASFSGIGDIGQAGDGSLLPPLVAQNGRYVMYLEAYNSVAYDHIVSHKWYLRDHLPEVPVPRPAVPPVQFPFGSIAVKSAWVEMKGFSKEAAEAVLHPDRYRPRSQHRKVRQRDRRPGRAAHHSEDAQPPAVDLEFVRTGGQRTAR